ncbi:hypothetical protein V8F33_001104 [Rhypophila sp. PSN 637]
MPSATEPPRPVLVQWILDTRSWYPEATQTKQLAIHASRALSLLPESERAGVLKYYHVRDAKMSLASALLKHLAVSKLAPVPWQSSTITRDGRTKPIFRDPTTGAQPVSFNVTHQAGLVALVAVAHYQPPTPESSPFSSPSPPSPASLPSSSETATPSPPPEAILPVSVDTGIDLVCTSERRDRDHRILETDGWPAFVDMHADVFAPSEAYYLKYQILSAIPSLFPQSNNSGLTLSQINDGKLRAFYALWALREAYVKLTGEALLAEWLRELEFIRFRPPLPAPEEPIDGSLGSSSDSEADSESSFLEDESEQVIRKIEIKFRGRQVDDVNICLKSMGPDYMICTAVRTPERKEDGLGWRLGGFEVLRLEDVLDFAETH